MRWLTILGMDTVERIVWGIVAGTLLAGLVACPMMPPEVRVNWRTESGYLPRTEGCFIWPALQFATVCVLVLVPKGAKRLFKRPGGNAPDPVLHFGNLRLLRHWVVLAAIIPLALGQVLTLADGLGFAVHEVIPAAFVFATAGLLVYLVHHRWQSYDAEAPALEAGTEIYRDEPPPSPLYVQLNLLGLVLLAVLGAGLTLLSARNSSLGFLIGLPPLVLCVYLGFDIHAAYRTVYRIQGGLLEIQRGFLARRVIPLEELGPVEFVRTWARPGKEEDGTAQHVFCNRFSHGVCLHHGAERLLITPSDINDLFAALARRSTKIPRAAH